MCSSNGGFGHDFTTDPGCIWQVAERIPAHGVTAFLPTIVSSSPAARARARAAVAGPPMGHRGAHAIGLHLEGPFLNPEAGGAHDPAMLRLPDAAARAEAADWTPATGVRLVTLAPELPGAIELIAQLASQGVRVAAGHSAAGYDAARAAIEAGIRYGTHLFNAMPAMHHRQPGLAGALLTDPRVTVGLIPDGIHLHPAVVGLVWRALGAGRVSVVTDATAALGMPPGSHTLAGREVTVDETSVRLAGDRRLAGSALAADEALRRLRSMTGCSPADAVASMTSVPADLLGLDDRGRLAPGQRADLVLFTVGLEVVATFVGGEAVHGQWA